MTDQSSSPAICNCLALRQAARQVTQLYDRFLAPAGVRATQYSILAKLKRQGPMTINALAADLVMDRTTLGRNVLPLQRDGLIAIGRSKTDRRSKELSLTRAGATRFAAASAAWARAQASFEHSFGAERARDLRHLMHDVTQAV
jgi:DNA-binding MarR family transcriptional regulator